MNKPMNLNVRVGGALKDHVVARISDTGDYDNASEYVRDLIRRDKERADYTKFEAKHAALQKTLELPNSDYNQITVAEIIGQATLPK
jgi:Arc/MetJ-type ribon-helix-helix transcriptional regulator